MTIVNKPLQLSDLPDKEYVHAAVVDRQPITLADVIEFMLVLKPLTLLAFRMMMVITWVILLASLILGRF